MRREKIDRKLYEMEKKIPKRRKDPKVSAEEFIEFVKTFDWDFDSKYDADQEEWRKGYRQYKRIYNMISNNRKVLMPVWREIRWKRDYGKC